jgi:hypothetical protein
MSPSDGESNIEVKKLEVKVGGVEVRIEKGEMYISAPSVNIEEGKAKKDREKKIADMQIAANADLVLMVFAAQLIPIDPIPVLGGILAAAGVGIMVYLFWQWKKI